MRISILALFSLFPSFIFSQDYIYKIDSTRVPAKVLEVNPYSIKYRLYNSPDTSEYSLDKNFIMLIVYENGTYDMFNYYRKKKPGRSMPDTSYKFLENIASYSMLDILVGNISADYERIFLKGRLGARIPLKFSFSKKSFLNNGYNKFWATGLDLKYYPGGQRSAGFFIGPSFETGQYYFRREYYNNTTHQVLRTNVLRKYQLATISNGFYFRAGPRLNFTLEAGFGFRFIEKDNNRPDAAIRVAYTMGFRF